MGRRPNSGYQIRKRRNKFEPEVRKTKHRDADCKYRSKVQYLYSKLKEILKEKSAKDNLLLDALSFIKSMETEITETVGSNRMNDCKEEFCEFILQEEKTLKKVKDLDKWWSSIEDTIGKDGEPEVLSSAENFTCKSSALPQVMLNSALKHDTSKSEENCCIDLSQQRPPELQPFKQLMNNEFSDCKKEDFPIWIFPDFKPNSKSDPGALPTSIMLDECPLADSSNSYFGSGPSIQLPPVSILENSEIENLQHPSSTFLYL